MRLTVEDCLEQGIRADVFVDGQESHHCVEADEEAGYAICYKTDNAGDPIVQLDPETGESFIPTVRLDGKVEIRIRDEVSA